MTYSYTVTTYNYNCQICGKYTSVGNPNQYILCLVCGIQLCKGCNVHNFCPNHFNALPEPLKSNMAKIEEDARSSRNTWFAVSIVGVILTFIGFFGVIFGSGDSIGDYIPCLFVFFLPLIIIFFAMMVYFQSAYKLSRKKQEAFLKANNIDLAPFKQIPSGKSAYRQAPAPAIAPPPVLPTPGGFPTGPDQNYIYCQRCGKANWKAAAFCYACGNQLR